MTPDNTPPMQWLLSDYMEDVRQNMLSGKENPLCQHCYHLEKHGARSPRILYNERSTYPTDVENVEVKMKIFGSLCNLGCYMCDPSQSSTRRAELKKVNWEDILFNVAQFKTKSPNKKEYEVIMEDVLQHIDKIKQIRILGGEPFMLGRQYQFLEQIPKEHRKRIRLIYDTNLTVREFKHWSIDWVIENFPKTELAVSVDHYKEKLQYMRYPINVNTLEENLKRYKSHIKQIQITVSLLNILDLVDIIDYYHNNFKILTLISNCVNAPPNLSIKQLSNEQKEWCRKTYKDKGLIMAELEKPRDEEGIPKFKKYIRNLDRVRSLNGYHLFSEVIDGL